MYLDLVGGQSWRMALQYVAAAPKTEHIGEEADLLSCLTGILNTDRGVSVTGASGEQGFGLPHLQQLALKMATDLRHYANIAGANLKSSKKLRKAARGSPAYSSWFRWLSCRTAEDTESLHKVFLPFASLATRIGTWDYSGLTCLDTDR